jgi:hypothetical protein
MTGAKLAFEWRICLGRPASGAVNVSLPRRTRSSVVGRRSSDFLAWRLVVNSYLIGYAFFVVWFIGRPKTDDRRPTTDKG